MGKRYKKWGKLNMVKFSQISPQSTEQSDLGFKFAILA